MINKVIAYGETLIDLSTDTLTSADQLAKGVVGHLRDGTTAVGTMESGSSDIPFIWGGLNAEKVAEYHETFTLADTSFEIGTSASTSATSIKATVSNRFTSPTIAIGDKDIVVVQNVTCQPTHSSSATSKALFLKGSYTHIAYISKRKTTDTSAKTTRQVGNISLNQIKYYNTSGTVTRAVASYGFYGTPQAPTVASTTAASTTVRCSSPILYYRASSSYESTANIKLVTDCVWEWQADVYLVEPQSTIIAAINDKNDAFLTG